MAKPCLIVVILAMLASGARADDVRYSLAELETLVGQKSFEEAFAHLRDIAPAQRSARWLDVAAAASAGMLATLPADDGTTLIVIDSIDREYPQLRGVASYARSREELGLRGLDGCFQHTRNCLQLGLRFADRSGDHRIALAVARLIVARSNAASAVPLFKRALGMKDQHVICRAGDLRIAVIAGLESPVGSATALDARAIMKTCWAALASSIVKAFDAGTKRGALHRNTCDVLESKGLLSSLEAKRCK